MFTSYKDSLILLKFPFLGFAKSFLYHDDISNQCNLTNEIGFSFFGQILCSPCLREHNCIDKALSFWDYK